MKRSAGLKTFMKRRTETFHHTIPGHTGIRVRKHIDEQLIKIKGKNKDLLKKILRIIKL